MMLVTVALGDRRRWGAAERSYLRLWQAFDVLTQRFRQANRFLSVICITAKCVVSVTNRFQNVRK